MLRILHELGASLEVARELQNLIHECGIRTMALSAVQFGVMAKSQCCPCMLIYEAGEDLNILMGHRGDPVFVGIEMERIFRQERGYGGAKVSAASLETSWS
jgi:hypothetical protein